MPSRKGMTTATSLLTNLRNVISHDMTCVAASVKVLYKRTSNWRRRLKSWQSTYRLSRRKLPPRVSVISVVTYVSVLVPFFTVFFPFQFPFQLNHWHLIPFLVVNQLRADLFFNVIIFSIFYPHDAMLVRVIEIATCLSVRLSVCASVRHAPVLCQNEES